jgi:N-acetylneuraminic acid mutarotase
MKKLFFILALFITSFSFGQNLQNANWCFKINAKINFNIVPPAVSTCASNPYNPYGGSGASVSSSSGQLLFYTDGVRVWDKNNNIMPNGSYIGGGTNNVWNQQTTIIVPKPNSWNLYYIFVVNKFLGGNTPTGRGGLHYSIVDICANNGNGDILVINGQNNFALNNQDGTPIDYDYNTNSGLQIFENRISSTLNDDKTKVWVSFFTRFNVGGVPQRYAYQYLVAQNGINNTADGTSPNPTTFLALDNANFPVPTNYSVYGAIKFSPHRNYPDDNYLCDANTSCVTLYNFDKQTGALTFKRNIYPFVSPWTAPGYGVEFSPNSQLLYFCTYDDKVYQEGINEVQKPNTKKYIRVRQQNINSEDSAIIVGEFEASPPASSTDNLLTPIPAIGSHGDLQLAINNKIYVCSDYAGVPQYGKLDAITLPDIPGIGCSYVIGDLTLANGTQHEGSLPQWVHKTIFTPVNNCPLPPCPSVISCSPINLSGCNYTTNGDFVPSGVYNPSNPTHVDAPFKYDLIPNWVETNGTPQITDEITFPITTPPPGISNYAYLFSTGWGYQGNSSSSGDGIAQKIPALTAGSSYSMSFFKKFAKPSGPSPFQFNMDKFYIVLMPCSSYSSIRTCDYTIAGFPANSQIVYCESNLSNANWEQVFFNFTANANYDMVWVFPKQAQGIFYNNGTGRSGVDFTGLEIIKTSNFTAGPNPTPTPPNCNVTIGNLNCGVANAVYTWYRNNIFYSSSTIPNSQIITNLNAGDPQNVGTWRLEMTVPNTITPTGTCIQTQTTISASVVVPSCMPPVPVGDWTWMNGDNVAYQYGVYGNLGVPSILNKPGARSSKIAWKDSQNDLWVFGGFGYASNSYGSLNDLWKYNINTGQWVWVSGDNIPNQYSTYGVQGVPSVNNKPATRGTTMNWKDNNGNFWIYGGGGYTPSTPSNFGYLNDQWKFNPNTNEWTWLRGNNSNGDNPYAIYGTMGVPSVNNHPGCRSGGATWTDLAGNLWLFGGWGYPSNTSSAGLLNDLWKYSPVTNEWMWVNGSNLINQAGSYGIKGVSSPLNMPSSRTLSRTWTDTQGNFYLFSGSAQYQSGPTQLLNDLWKYNPVNNEWTWINGSNLINQNGIFSSYGIPNANNSPGSRMNSNIFLDNNSNTVFLFSGWGYGSVGNQRNLQDLWKYDNSTNEWLCIKEYHTVYGGSIDYGTMGVSSPNNRPGNREDAASWVDNLGRLWMFGGRSYSGNVSGERNDLWKYTGNCTGPNCFTGKSNNSTNFLNRNVQNGAAGSFSKKEEIPTSVITKVSNIQSLEIYNTAGQLLKKVNSDLESYDVLRNSKVAGLIPGLYFIKVFYKDKTFKTIRQFLQ